MLRNILRTSRWLARKQINIVPALFTRQYTYLQGHRTCYNPVSVRQYSGPSDTLEASESVDQVVFEEICNETLESLCDYFEEIVEESPNFKGADITFSVSVFVFFFLQIHPFA